MQLEPPSWVFVLHVSEICRVRTQSLPMSTASRALASEERKLREPRVTAKEQLQKFLRTEPWAESSG